MRNPSARIDLQTVLAGCPALQRAAAMERRAGMVRARQGAGASRGMQRRPAALGPAKRCCERSAGQPADKGLMNCAERGSVLLYVVWVIMLLSVFATTVSSQGSFAIQLSERLTGQLQAAYLARAAVQFAAVMLERDPSPGIDGLSEEWSNSEVIFKSHALAGGTFDVSLEEPNGQKRYGMSDEEGLINLNTAPMEVLQRLLEHLGQLPGDQAAEVASAIVDWRDKDDDRQPPRGAEDFDYQTGEGYDCKDAPFEQLEELLLVKGMTIRLYQRLADVVTVRGSGQVNLNTAGEDVLLALGLEPPSIDAFIAFRRGDDGQDGTPDDRVLAGLDELLSVISLVVSTTERKRLTELTAQRLLEIRSRTFRMQIEAQGHRGAQIRAVCVMDREGSVLLWDEL